MGQGVVCNRLVGMPEGLEQTKRGDGLLSANELEALAEAAADRRLEGS